MIPYRIFADVVSVIHAGYAVFVVAGLVLIFIGFVFGWSWIRNFWFRVIHLATMLIVGVEAVLGITCPLTELEKYLRRLGGQQPYSGDFLGEWANRLLYLDLPQWVFTVGHIGFAVLVLSTFFLVPPRWPQRSPPSEAEQERQLVRPQREHCEPGPRGTTAASRRGSWLP